uniref:Uncharacterized protein n=1 Tax=Arundo donax TaxID=35708 RepID=A0A0A9CMJ3_ARUDO
MRLPSVGCHDMCFSFVSELIQEFCLGFLVFILFLTSLGCLCNMHTCFGCDFFCNDDN